MTGSQRSAPARIGLVLLNLLAPGLGLVRLGAWRGALPWLLAIPVVVSAVTLVLLVTPIPSFRAFCAIAALLLLAGLAAWIVPMVQTWRGSLFRPSTLPWWSRWYSMVLIAVLASVAAQLAVHGFHQLYKPFYAPAESMAPTVLKNDKFVADMRGGREPARGDIVLFEAQGQVRDDRVVALEGDRVAMRHGVPIVNGRPAEQRRVGSMDVLGFDGSGVAERLEERLPGETGSHFVLNEGTIEFDDMEERVVPAGHIFVLGDNRDRSADSRVPASLSGVGMVPVSAIRGRPLYIHWSVDRSRIGTAINTRRPTQ